MSSSISVTVAPNLIVDPDSFDTSITSARCEHVLELDDAALVVRLRLLGGMIFGVLRQIAVRARLGDRLDDARALDLLAAPELRLEGGVAGDRDRKLFHR